MPICWRTIVPFCNSLLGCSFIPLACSSPTRPKARSSLRSAPLRHLAHPLYLGIPDWLFARRSSGQTLYLCTLAIGLGLAAVIVHVTKNRFLALPLHFLIAAAAIITAFQLITLWGLIKNLLGSLNLARVLTMRLLIKFWCYWRDFAANCHLCIRVLLVQSIEKALS